MGWFKAIPQFLDLFKEGKELADAKTWKERTVATNAVAAALGTAVLLAKAFGYNLAIDQDTLASLGAGVVALVSVANAVMHTISSSKIGLSANSTDSSSG